MIEIQIPLSKPIMLLSRTTIATMSFLLLLLLSFAELMRTHQSWRDICIIFYLLSPCFPLHALAMNFWNRCHPDLEDSVCACSVIYRFHRSHQILREMKSVINSYNRAKAKLLYSTFEKLNRHTHIHTHSDNNDSNNNQ